MIKAETLGRRRWKEGQPRSSPVTPLGLARCFNFPFAAVLCLAWIWPHVNSPMSFLGASMATAAIYMLCCPAGLILAHLLLLAVGWSRIEGEGGGGSPSLYSPDLDPGGDSLPWKVEAPSLTLRR